MSARGSLALAPGGWDPSARPWGGAETPCGCQATTGRCPRPGGLYAAPRAVRADGLFVLVVLTALLGRLGAPIAQRMIEYFSAARTESVEPAFPQLTDRERHVLDLIAQGNSNQAIAQSLVLSPKTVRNHVSNIFAKLQVADRAEAIVQAREAGLGRPHRRPE